MKIKTLKLISCIFLCTAAFAICSTADERLPGNLKNLKYMCYFDQEIVGTPPLTCPGNKNLTFQIFNKELKNSNLSRTKISYLVDLPYKPDEVGSCNILTPAVIRARVKTIGTSVSRTTRKLKISGTIGRKNLPKALDARFRIEAGLGQIFVLPGNNAVYRGSTKTRNGKDIETLINGNCVDIEKSGV